MRTGGLIVLVAALAVSCSGAPNPVAPIERQIYLEDLLPRLAEEGAGGSLTLELPAGAALELAGSVRPAGEDGPTRASARFVIRQDGEERLDRTLASDGEPVSFTAVLPLSGGRTSHLELSIETDPSAAAARWTWLSLLRIERVARRPEAEGPNLLLLLVDTLRADHLGLHGYARETSPNLERLAGGAAVFERAISSSSWTHPATASLLTGLTPARHGVLGGARLSPFAASLPQILQASGFTTFGFSANPVIGRGSGFHRGFETFRQEPWARADAVNRELLHWLRGREGVRWFAYLHYIDPHAPYDAPGRPGREFTGGYAGPFRSRDSFDALVKRVNEEGAPPGVTAQDLDYLVGAYDGEIRFWDRELGSLLGEMEEHGLLANTVVVVVSDHGEEFLEHGKLKHGLQLFDESVRVPLVVRAPSGLQAGRRAAQVETRGLARALLDLLGVPAEGMPPDEVPSLLDAGSGPVISHTTLPFRDGDTERRSLMSVRDGSWKAILDEDGRLTLYDLEADAGESRDVAGREPALAARYREILESYRRTPPLSTNPSSPVDPETRRRLRALGYVH